MLKFGIGKIGTKLSWRFEIELKSMHRPHSYPTYKVKLLLNDQKKKNWSPKIPPPICFFVEYTFHCSWDNDLWDLAFLGCNFIYSWDFYLFLRGMYVGLLFLGKSLDCALAAPTFNCDPLNDEVHMVSNRKFRTFKTITLKSCKAADIKKLTER